MGAWLIMAVNGALLGVCCFVVANVVTEIGAEVLEPMPLDAAPVRIVADFEGPPATPSVILDRNLFGAQLVGDTQTSEEETAIQLAATKLPLKLLGTAAASVEDLSRAAIEDTKTRKHMIVAVGDRLDGHSRVRVTGIERTRVILDNAGRPEELALNEEDPTARRPKPTRRKSQRASRKRQANLDDDLKNRLDRLAGDDGQGIARILSSARILPHYVEGEMRGMKVDAIKAASVFEKIGFQNGDIITEVNGIVIDRIEATNAIFDEFATADAIETNILRGGNPLTLSADADELLEQP